MNNADVLLEISIRLDPRSVLNLCQVNKYIAITYNDTTFAKLMTIHYPNCKITETPRNQYLAVTAGMETRYWIRVDTSSSYSILDTNGNKIIILDKFFDNTRICDENFTLDER